MNEYSATEKKGEEEEEEEGLYILCIYILSLIVGIAERFFVVVCRLYSAVCVCLDMLCRCAACVCHQLARMRLSFIETRVTTVAAQQTPFAHFILLLLLLLMCKEQLSTIRRCRRRRPAHTKLDTIHNDAFIFSPLPADTCIFIPTIQTVHTHTEILFFFLSFFLSFFAFFFQYAQSSPVQSSELSSSSSSSI